MRYLLLLVVLLFGTGVKAQPLRVSTGEHDGFTRVVIYLPADTAWEFGRYDEGYVVQLPLQEGFDTDGFFSVIARDRVTAVSQDGENGRLFLELACICRARAYDFDPNLLVIDIRDGTPDPASPFEITLPLENRAAAIESGNQVDTLAPRPLFPVIFPETSAPERSALAVLPQPAPVLENQPAPEPSGPNPDMQDDLTALQQSIAQGMSRALSQGLLELDSPSDIPTPQDTMAGQKNAAPLPGLKASTSVDIGAVSSARAETVTQTGDSCLPASLFDIATWGDTRDFATQMSEARSRVTTEFDRTDPAAIQALAQLYLYFGFGREALHVMDVDGGRSQERRALVAMAQIIDEDTVTDNLLDRQESCASAVALWAFLKLGPAESDVIVDRAAVLRAFKALPDALQRHLAPRLSQRFIAIEDFDAANQIVAIFQREQEKPLDAEMAEASLNRALGNEDDALEITENIVATSPRTTPEIMLALFEDSAATGRRVTPEEFLLADALRFENAQLPVAIDLGIAQIRAHIRQADFAAATAFLKDMSDDLQDSQIAMLREEFAQTAVTQMDDLAFLRFAVSEEAGPLPAETENAVATRLLDLGFPDLANAAMASLADGETARERRFLRAATAIAEGNPQDALGLLTGETGERADTLRAAAQRLLATEQLATDEQVASDDAFERWLQGDWRGTEDAGSPSATAPTPVLNAPDDLQPDSTTPLADGRNLLDRSAESRAALDNLLAEFAAPDDL